MDKQQKFTAGDKFGQWYLIRPIVTSKDNLWLVNHSHINQLAVIKICTATSQKLLNIFAAELKIILADDAENIGLLPILDHTANWYVTPYATSFANSIDIFASQLHVVKKFIAYIEILENLVNKNYIHGDLKLQNLMVHNDQMVVVGMLPGNIKYSPSSTNLATNFLHHMIAILINLKLNTTVLEEYLTQGINLRVNLLELKDYLIKWVKQEENLDYSLIFDKSIQAIKHQNIDNILLLSHQLRNLQPHNPCWINIYFSYLYLNDDIEYATTILLIAQARYPAETSFNDNLSLVEKKILSDQKRYNINKFKNQSQYTKGSEINNWRFIEDIQSKGNELWQVQHNVTKLTGIIKICCSTLEAEVNQFINEFNILMKLQKSPNFLPILDHFSYNKDADKSDLLWFVMPISTSFVKNLVLPTQVMVIKKLVEYIDIMLFLPNYGYIYEDLKEEHLMDYNGESVLIDLGLAKYSEVAKINGVNQRYSKTMSQMIIGIAKNIIKKLGLYNSDINEVFSQWYTNEFDLEQLKECWLGWCKQQIDIIPLIKQAYIELEKNDFSKALSLVHKIRNADKDNFDGLFIMGTCLSKFGNFNLAKELLLQAIKLQPNKETIYVAIGEIYFRQGDFKLAIEQYEQIKELDKNNHSYLDQLGMARTALLTQEKIALAAAIADSKSEISLTEVQQKQLLKVFKSLPEKIIGNQYKLLVKSEDNLPYKFNEISWDQYFYDLSHGSFRLCTDGSRRGVTYRCWHFVFKNMALINKIFNYQQQNISLLDFGCSSGYFRRFLEGNSSENQSTQIYYYGLDIRYEMLQMATFLDDYLESGASGNITPSLFLQHDATQKMPFNDNSFDIIISLEMIKYLPKNQIDNILQELKRVLKNSGKAFISTTYTQQHTQTIEGIEPTVFMEHLKHNGFVIQEVYGGQATFTNLEKNIKSEHLELFKQLKEYHPKEVVCAMLAPIYPDASLQKIYYLQCVKDR